MAGGVEAGEGCRGAGARELEGIALGLGTAVLWSVTGLLIRFVEAATTQQIIVVRSLAMLAGLSLYILLRYRGRTLSVLRAMGATGLVAGLILGLGFVSYVSAITHTTVANVSFINSLVPFVTALLARLVLGEAVRPRAWRTMAVASAGVALMVADSVSVGGSLGLLFALAGTTLQSAYTVALRRGRGADMMPSICLAAAIAAGFGFALGGDLEVSLHDAGVVAFAGLGSTALGNIVYIAAARRVRAAELALLTLAEVVLSPFWVWIAIGETPTPLALAGGLVVLGAVAWHAARARRA